MLRALLIAASAALACAGIALVLAGVHGPGWELLVLGLLVLAGTVFERWRYRRVGSDRPEGQWQRTRERFIDPATGDAVEVLFNPETGEREYVKATAPRSSDPPP